MGGDVVKRVGRRVVKRVWRRVGRRWDVVVPNFAQELLAVAGTWLHPDFQRTTWIFLRENSSTTIDDNERIHLLTHRVSSIIVF